MLGLCRPTQWSRASSNEVGQPQASPDFTSRWPLPSWYMSLERGSCGTWHGPSLGWGRAVCGGARDAHGMLMPAQGSQTLQTPPKSQRLCPGSCSCHPLKDIRSHQPLSCCQPVRAPAAGQGVFSVAGHILPLSSWEGGSSGWSGEGHSCPGLRSGSRAVGEALPAHNGPCCPELSPLIPESGQANSEEL